MRPTRARFIPALFGMLAILSATAVPAQVGPVFEIPGETADSALGTSIASGGDFNADGFPDFAVGAPGGGSALEGRVLVFFGGPALDATFDVSFTGVEALSRFGASVAFADYDGDGIDDLLVGAPAQDVASLTDQGVVWVFFGGPAPPPAILLNSPIVNQFFGASVASAGDFNNDGNEDVVAGMPGNDPGSTGQAFVYFGGPTESPDIDVTLDGFVDFDAFGASVCGGFDLNGDTIDDIAVGAPRAGGAVGPGQAWVYFGAAVPDGSADVAYSGFLPGDFFGQSVSSPGDVDNDGFDDLLVGAPNHSPAPPFNSGAVFGFAGAAAPATNPVLVLESGEEQGRFGWSVAPAGDLDGDPFADFLVGQPGTAAFQMFRGASDWNPASDPLVFGPPLSEFGTAVAALGDVTGDGMNEFLAGAPSDAATGIAYLFTAQPAPLCDVVPPGVLDLGQVIQNQSVQGSVVLRNLGDAPMVGTVFSPCVELVVVGNSSYNVAPGDSTVITFQFVETDPGQFGCTVDLGSVCASLDVVAEVLPAVVDCRILPDTLQFGEVEVGSSAQAPLRLVNTGTENVLGQMDLLFCPDVAFVGNTIYDLDPGDTADFVLQYTPQAVGSLFCAITTDCDSSLALGTAIVAQTESCETDRETVVFGEVAVGTEKFLGFTLTNTGNVDIAGVLAVPPACPALTVEGDPAYNLGPGQSRAFTLRYGPLQQGPLDCTLDFACDSIRVLGTAVVLDCEIVPPSLSFGAVQIDDAKTLAFTIRNTGTGRLDGTVSLPDTCDDFSLSETGPFSIPVGESRTYQATFRPTAQARQICTVDLGNPVCPSIDMVGTGTTVPVSACEVVPDTLDFGSLNPGEVDSLRFTVRNIGTTEVRGTVVVDALCAGLELVGNPSYVLDSGQEREFELRWSPADTGNFVCLVDVGDTGDLCGPVTALGRGILTACEFDPPSGLNFGVIAVGDSAENTFVLRNVGTERLVGVVDGMDCPEFPRVGPLAYDLASGESRTFAVRFVPQDPGPELCFFDLGSTCGFLPVAGNGVELPVCRVEPAALVFGAVRTDSTRSLTLRLFNDGRGLLTGTLGLPDSCGSFRVVGEPSYSLLTGQSRDFVIEFSPTGAGGFAGCLLDVGPDCNAVPLNGFGAPFVTVTVPPFRSRVHQLWSTPVVPLALEENGRLQDLLDGAFGVMSPLTWRGFSQENESAFENPSLAVARGYWINTVLTLPEGFELNGYLDGVEQTLITGWNLLGVPWLTRVNTKDLEFAAVGSEFRSTQDAVIAGLIAGTGYDYADGSPDLINNGEYVPSPLAHPGTVLEPFTALLVFAFEPLTVRFPPPGAASPGMFAAADFPEPTWSVSITATAAAGRTARMRVGARPGADGEWDPADRPAPPSPPDGSLRLGLDHRNWRHRGAVYGESWIDDGASHPSWTAELSGFEGPVTLTWVLDGLGSERTAYLRFEDGTVTPLVPGGSQRVSSRSRGVRFELGVTADEVVGTGGAPGAIRMVRPNPWLGGAVELEYDVARPATASLRILDVRGRVVRDVGSVSGDPGRWIVHWDGRDDRGVETPAGVYYFRLTLDGTLLTSRVVRVR